MADVRIEDPPATNVLGLFLAASLRRNLVDRGKPCRIRGALAVDAEGMRARVVFGDDAVDVARGDGPARATISGSLPDLVAALVHPRPRTLLRVKVRGNRLFALRAFFLLAP